MSPGTFKPWDDRDTTPRYLDLAVVIGRFQPVTNNHLALFKRAAEVAPRQLILVGSSFIARDIRNPFTFKERQEMIKMVTEDLFKDSDIVPIMDDLYNNQFWIGNVQTQIDQFLEERGLDPKTARVGVVGHHKDHTSYYLDMFPKYINVEVPGQMGASGTKIRDLLFDETLSSDQDIPREIFSYLYNWRKVNYETWRNLCGEYQFLKDYKKQFEDLKYPPTFVTVDAVVICHGHILLVKRRSYPGKGLWALPGGFLNQNETIETAILRELYEETKIKVNPELLKACMKGTHVFDAPARSLRGRTISHAGLFVLNTPELPRIKGSDDAEKANWVPLSQFYDMTENLFEDHYSIGTFMISRAG